MLCGWRAVSVTIHSNLQDRAHFFPVILMLVRLVVMENFEGSFDVLPCPHDCKFHCCIISYCHPQYGMCSCCILNRFQGLQRVLVSIGVTLFPLFNTFVIYIIVNSICAVLAAQFFGEVNNELFGSFFKVYFFLISASFEFCRYALVIQLLTVCVYACVRVCARACVHVCVHFTSDMAHHGTN